MKVLFYCSCHWSQEKQNRIATLIGNRAELILGKSVSMKIKEIIFYDNSVPSAFSAHIRGNSSLEKNSKDEYTILLNSTILFSMIEPGDGQAAFDEQISAAKRTICVLAGGDNIH